MCREKAESTRCTCMRYCSSLSCPIDTPPVRNATRKFPRFHTHLWHPPTDVSNSDLVHLPIHHHSTRLFICDNSHRNHCAGFVFFEDSLIKWERLDWNLKKISAHPFLFPLRKKIAEDRCTIVYPSFSKLSGADLGKLYCLSIFHFSYN